MVALAEGLQTSFWRLDRAGVADELTWYSIDLPPVMALREQLLPRDERIVALAQSALDRSWMDRVDASHGVFITAEGLLMYLEPDDALGLIRDCAARFPGGRMMFDSIPRFFSQPHAEGLQAVRPLHRPADAVRPCPPDEGARAWPGRIPGCAPHATSRCRRPRAVVKWRLATAGPDRLRPPHPTQHDAAGVRR